MAKIDRLARSTSDLYLADKGAAFRVIDDPTIDTTFRTGKLVMGILALIAEFENDTRRAEAAHYRASRKHSIFRLSHSRLSATGTSFSAMSGANWRPLKL